MTNSTLITVFSGQISNQAVQLCNARDLHAFLEVKTQFGNWIADRISDYGFIQDEDYIIVTERTNGRPRKEYHITLDMGKELGMVERNEKGRQIRKFFIECERKLKEIQQQNLPLARQERMMTVRLPESDLKDIAWLWFAADKMQKFIDSLQPALQILGSNLYGTAYSYQKEYGDLIQFIGPMIYKLTKDVDFSDRPTPIKALEQTIAQPKPKRLAKF